MVQTQAQCHLMDFALFWVPVKIFFVFVYRLKLQEYFGVILIRVKGSVMVIHPLQLLQSTSDIARLEATITKNITKSCKSIRLQGT